MTKFGYMKILPLKIWNKAISEACRWHCIHATSNLCARSPQIAPLAAALHWNKAPIRTTQLAKRNMTPWKTVRSLALQRRWTIFHALSNMVRSPCVSVLPHSKSREGPNCCRRPKARKSNHNVRFTTQVALHETLFFLSLCRLESVSMKPPQEHPLCPFRYSPKTLR